MENLEKDIGKGQKNNMDENVLQKLKKKSKIMKI